jgi:hypothetical protein
MMFGVIESWIVLVIFLGIYSMNIDMQFVSNLSQFH